MKLIRDCLDPRFRKYIISDNGQIWSRSKKVYIKPALNGDGYPTVNVITSLAKDGYRQSFAVHRIIALLFVPNPHGYKEVNHIDGNKQNNHYSNLEWCDRSYNIKHCHALGLRSSKGVNNGNYKTGKYAVV